MGCVIFRRCVGVCDYKGFMGEQINNMTDAEKKINEIKYLIIKYHMQTLSDDEMSNFESDIINLMKKDVEKFGLKETKWA